MEPDTRSQKLLEIITHGLARYATRNTQTQLENREKYIGMSDSEATWPVPVWPF